MIRFQVWSQRLPKNSLWQKTWWCLGVILKPVWVLREKKKEEIDSSENENGNKLKLNLWNVELIIQLPAQAAAMPIFKS